MKKTLILILLAASTVVTSCMDKDIYDPSKQKDDNSTQELDLSFKYYRMDNTYPWALDIPRISSEAPSWRYPLEGENITGVYLNYEKWIHDKSDYNWFDSSVSGNVDNDKLY